MTTHNWTGRPVTRNTRDNRGRSKLRVVTIDGVASATGLYCDQLEAIERRSAAPQVTIEALMTAFRAGGLKALDQPENQERLSRLSSAQLDELRARIKKWIAKNG